MSDTVFVPDDHASALDRLSGYAKAVLANPATIGGLRVKLTGGIHRGIISVFESKAFTVGGGPENDLILIGDGLAEKHLRIAPDGSLGRGMRIEALEGRVEIEGKVVLQPGEWAELTGAHVVHAGRARFEVGPVLDGVQMLRGLVFAASVGILAFIAFSIALSTWTQTRTGLTGLLPGQIQPAAVSAPAASVPVAEAGEMARIQLETLGIAHMIRQSALDNALKFDGLVPESHSAGWMTFLQWYDSQRGFPSMLNGVSITGGSEDIPSITTVWLGERAMVEFSDGTRGTVGSILKGGWRIVEIARNAVSFERNGATIQVSY